MVWGEIPGFSQYKMGRMNRDVCSADIRSVESICVKRQLNKWRLPETAYNFRI
jgi:hypothetical protein